MEDFTGDKRGTNYSYPGLSTLNMYSQEPMTGKNRVGYFSRDTTKHFVNVQPFWSEPVNILPHNLYASTKIPVADTNTLNVNVLGYASLLVLSTYWGPNAYKGVLAGSGALWLLWATDLIPGSRKALTSPEVWNILEK